MQALLKGMWQVPGWQIAQMMAAWALWVIMHINEWSRLSLSDN